MIDRNQGLQEESAVLVGLMQKNQTETQVQEYLDELSFLAETAGAKALKKFAQRLTAPDSRTFVGKGKRNGPSYREGQDLIAAQAASRDRQAGIHSAQGAW